MGEVIDDSPVEEELPVDLYRFEKERERHRCPDGFPDIAFGEDDLLVAVHFGGNAAERDEQLVKVASRNGGGGGHHFHKSEIHLPLGNDVRGGQDLYLVLPPLQLQIYPPGILFGLLEEIAVFLLDLAGGPEVKFVGTEKRFHLCGGVPCGIQPSDDGPHRGAGNIIDRDVIGLQNLDDADVCQTPGTPAAQNKSHLLTMCRGEYS